MGSWKAAEGAFADALLLVANDAERRFLERRVAEMKGKIGG
jgi:predicted RNA polymerase sigma factor